MNTKNRLPDAETSTLDDDRINRLIARYYNFHDSSKELQVGDFKTDRTCATNTRARKNMKRTAPPYTISLVQVNPMMDSNFVYKIRSNDADSEKEQDDDNFNIKILSDDDSLHSPSNYSVSSGPKSSWKGFKISCDADRSNRVTFQDDTKNEEQQTSFTYDVRKSYAEKTTYCRPITNIYDSNFVHKVMERNTKLQLLLTKFLITRQKEKENEKWNNYVNDLIMMNHCYRDLSKHALPPGMVQEDINPTLVNDFYSAKNKLTKSDSCREILNDFYTSKNEQYIENPPEYEERECFNNNTLKNVYDNQQYCFPSTSRDKRTNKERNNHDWPYHRSLYGSSIVVSDENLSNNATITNGKLRISSPKSARSTKLSSHLDKTKYVQTHITFGGYANSPTYFENDLKTELRATVSEQYVSAEDKNNIENKAARKEQYDIATESFSDLKEMPTKSIPRLKTPIKGLDEKLETLIKLFSSFIVDLKSKEELKSDQSNDIVDINDTDRNLTSNQSTSKSVKKKKKKVTIVGNVMTNTSLSAFEQQSQFNTSQNLLNSKLNKILYEELDKSNKLRNEIEAMLKTTCRPCAVQINIEVPTKERSTEVTDSLPKTTLSVSRSSEMPIEDVCSSFDRPAPQGRLVNESRELSTSMRRIAENTDPWGLLSVLRFSTDAVKQILSLVPTVNRWHMTSDPPQAADEANYVCNVCGAVFRRPSQLSAHILGHDLGQARTSICHQSPGTVAPSMFRCEYCGQRFIRAYCCELHQQSCAQRLGRSEGSSSLVMLR